MITSIRTKICCILSEEEAAVAARAGAYAIGLVSEMPSGPGMLPEARIAQIAAAAAVHVSTFLLTSRTEPAAIAAQHAQCGTDTLQLCARMTPDALQQLRGLLPNVRLVQVVHVEDASAEAEALALAPLVDFLLLDSGRTKTPVPELGGTGRVHDWSVSRRIAKQSRTPVFVAGGLTPGNVGEAIGFIQPFGVDVCSGVRTHGDLDPDKVKAFLAAVETATRR